MCEYDIKTITKWEAPKEDGVAILTMPNCPLPLHGLAPRTIMGRTEWDKYRKRCYERAKYTCQASGMYLGKGKIDAHELYTVDWANQTATFERAVGLNHHLHTIFIHSGRAITIFERGGPTVPRSLMLATLKAGFELISEYNMKHYDEEPLRVFDTILEWAKNPMLERDVNGLIEKYKIKFYTFNKKYINKKHWGNWKLIYNGKEYPTKFTNQKDWEDYYKPNPVEKIEDDNLSMLDAILKESKNGKS